MGTTAVVLLPAAQEHGWSCRRAQHLASRATGSVPCHRQCPLPRGVTAGSQIGLLPATHPETAQGMGSSIPGLTADAGLASRFLSDPPKSTGHFRLNFISMGLFWAKYKEEVLENLS